MRARPLTVLLIALIGGACLPIPIKQDGLLRPQLVVEVTDAAGGPVANADVILRRAETAPSPIRELTRFSTRTDASGHARFDAARTKDTTLPLMMHGVPELSFHVCVTSPHGAVTERLQTSPRDATASPERIAVTLDPAQSACAW